MMIVRLVAAGLGFGVSVGAQNFEVPDAAGMKRYKGNLHAHSFRSVGKQGPQGLVTWYRDNGYQFLVITDDRYPSTLDFVRQVNDAAFRLLPGMEVKAKSGQSWVRVNGINAAVPVAPWDGPSLLETLQGNIEAVRAVDGIPQIDHPRYMNGPDRETIPTSKGCILMEIQNGVAGPDQPEENGLCYASSGVELADRSIEPTRATISIKTIDTMACSTSFIGDNGRVLHATSQNTAIFDLSEKLIYVRAKVTDSAGKAAWIQPVFVK